MKRVKKVLILISVIVFVNYIIHLPMCVDDYVHKSYLLQKQNAAYKDYCKRNDLRELQDRLMIAKWNRQNAAKARGAAKRYKTAKGID